LREGTVPRSQLLQSSYHKEPVPREVQIQRIQTLK
jgi:hypothetical protein